MVESFAISDPVRFWSGKKFDLEHDLESALHPGLHVISPEVLIKKSRPVGPCKDSVLESSPKIELPVSVDLSNVLSAQELPVPELLKFLYQTEEVLNQSEVSYQPLSINPPKLELLDFGEEFKLESFWFSENSISLVEVPTLAPSEPKLMKKESGQPSHAADLESTRIEAKTDSFSVVEASLLTSVLGMTLECNLVYHETDFHWLHRGNSHSVYGWDQNAPTR